MVTYRIFFSKQAHKDKILLKRSGLEDKTKKLLGILQQNPFQNPPPYEGLVGNLEGFFSRRINLKHRLVYKVLEDEKAVLIVRMWTHYENL